MADAMTGMSKTVVADCELAVSHCRVDGYLSRDDSYFIESVGAAEFLEPWCAHPSSPFIQPQQWAVDLGRHIERNTVGGKIVAQNVTNADIKVNKK